MHICACACMCAHICPYIGIHTSHLSILKLTNIHFYGYKKTYVYCVFINMHKYMFLHFPIILPNAFQHLVFRVWGTSSNVANGSEAHAHTVFPPKSMSHCFSGRSMGTFFSYKKSLTSVLFSHKKKKKKTSKGPGAKNTECIKFTISSGLQWSLQNSSQKPGEWKRGSSPFKIRV